MKHACPTAQNHTRNHPFKEQEEKEERHPMTFEELPYLVRRCCTTSNYKRYAGLYRIPESELLQLLLNRRENQSLQLPRKRKIGRKSQKTLKKSQRREQTTRLIPPVTSLV